MRKASFLPLVGLVIFAVIILNIDTGRLLSILSSADPALVSCSILLAVPNIILKSLKWNVIIRSYGTGYSLLKSIRAWLSGFFLGIITPGRIGDLSRALYLRKETGLSGGKSLTTVFLDRINDIVVLFCFSLAGMAVIAGGMSQGTGLLAYISGAFLIFLVLVAALMRKSIILRVARPLSLRLLPSRYHNVLGRAFHDFYEGLSGMRKPMLGAAVLLCVVTWIISISQFWLLSSAIGLDLPYTFFMGVVPIAVLLDTLPVSFSGIGTRDAALIFFFSLVSIPSESAVSLSLLSFMTTYVVMGAAGAVLWVSNPIRSSDVLKEFRSAP